MLNKTRKWDHSNSKNRKSRQFVKSFSSLRCFKFSQLTGYGRCFVSCMCGQGKRVSNDWILDRFDIPVPPTTTWQLCALNVNITDRHCKRKKGQRNTYCPCQTPPQSPKPKLTVCSFSSPTWGTWPCSTGVIYLLLISGVINLPCQSTAQVLTA